MTARDLSTLPKSWELVEFQQIGDFLRGPFGSSIKKSVCVGKAPDTFKVYEQGNVIQNNFKKGKYYITKERFEDLKKFELLAGDVVITCAGTLGKIAVVPEGIEKGIINSVLMRIRLNNTRVLTKYFLYYFQSPEVQARIFTRSPGATIKNLFATKNLRSFKTPLPPLPVQKRIVASVEKADDLRQRREKTNQMTNAIACSVFLEMFGSVDPKNKIGDIATHVSSGSTPLGGEKTYSKEGIIFIRSQNVLMNSLDLQDVAHISEKTHYEMKRTWVKNGDVLLNITGASMGRVAVFRGEDNQANVNQHVCIIRLDQTKALPEYVSFYLSSPRGQKQMWTIQAGASRQALNYNQVRLLGVYLPSLDEQSEFVMITRRIDSLRNKQAQSTKRIDELFHSLVQKAFDGDLPTGEKGNQKIDKSLFESEPV